MIQLSRSEISLKLLNAADAELLRQWRNDERIRSNMIYREIITEEEQQQWFKRINNEHHYFFLIKVNEQSIGMIHMSEIDFTKQTAFSGMFIYNDKFIGTPIAVMASTLLLDFFFPFFKLQQIFAKVLNNNERALKYNLALGFQQISSSNENQLLLITPSGYREGASQLKSALAQLGQDKIHVQIEQDFLNQRPLFNSYLQAYIKAFAEDEAINVAIV